MIACRAILNYLPAAGIVSVPIAEIHQTTHDEVLDLLYTSKAQDDPCHVELAAADVAKKVAEIVGTYVPEYTATVAATKANFKELSAIKDSVKLSKEITLPQYVLFLATTQPRR